MDSNRTKKNTNKKREFSKTLLIQESILIWIITISFIIMAFMSINKGYIGSLPWLTAMVSCPWVAYGVSQAFYYNKSKAENTANGIKYDAMIKEYDNKIKPMNNIQIEQTVIDPWGPI